MRALFLKFISYKQIRFLVSGGLSAVVHFSVLFVLTHFFSIWYGYATSLGFLCAVGFNFIAQKFFTFQSAQTTTLKTESILFFTVAILNLVLNTGLMIVFVEYAQFHTLLAQLVTSTLIAVWSYIAYGTLFGDRIAVL